MFENNIIIYKFVQDLHFYVTGAEEENELILASVLQGFFDAVDILLRYTPNLILFALFSCFCGALFISRLVVLGAMWIRGRRLKIWISFFCALMKLLMAGKHIFVLC